MLRQLQSHGFRLAVLSNKPAPFAPRLVEYVFGDSFFEMIQGELPGVPLKPDPTSAVAIAHEFALPTGRIAFVGDSATDMQTARNANMFAVGVTQSRRVARPIFSIILSTILVMAPDSRRQRTLRLSLAELTNRLTDQ